MSRDAPCSTALNTLIQTSQPCSTRWHTRDTDRRMHFESSHTKITPNSGVDQGCPLSTCGFSAATDPVLRFVLADLCRLLDDGAKLFAYMDDWYFWIKPQCLNEALVLIAVATRSVYLELFARTPVPQAFLNKVKPTLNCLGGHLHIQGDRWRKPRNVSEVLRPPC